MCARPFDAATRRSRRSVNRNGTCRGSGHGNGIDGSDGIGTRRSRGTGGRGIRGIDSFGNVTTSPTAMAPFSGRAHRLSPIAGDGGLY
jgi:hypothetical protein